MIKDLVLLSSDGTGPGSIDTLPEAVQSGAALNVRRLTQLGTWDSSAALFTSDATASLTSANTHVLMVVKKSATDMDATADFGRKLRVSFVKADAFSADAAGGDTLVTPAFESNMAAGTPTPEIPGILSAESPIIPRKSTT